MTTEQKERLAELKTIAINTFMERADFDYADWLDEKESLEYKELNDLLIQDFEFKNRHIGL